MCPHRGAVLSYAFRNSVAPYEAGEREACNVFFVWEMCRPLLCGATLYVIPDDVIYDPQALVAYIARHGITRMLYTPSLLEAVLDHPSLTDIDRVSKLASLRVVLLCGEVVTVELRARALKVHLCGPLPMSSALLVPQCLSRRRSLRLVCSCGISTASPRPMTCAWWIWPSTRA